MRRDQDGTDNGRVSLEIASTKIVVGTRYTMTVIYTVGPRAVAVGGCLRFKLPGLELVKAREPVASCSNLEVELNYTNVLPPIDGKDGAEFFTLDYLFVTIEQAPMEPGDTISVRYGQSLPMHRTAAPLMAQRWPVEVATDLDGSRSAPGSGLSMVTDLPVLDFVNDKPFYLEVTVPSYTQTGARFEAVIRARDRHHNICSDYEGTVTLSSGSGDRSAPLGAYTFTAADRGVHTCSDLVLPSDGIHRITAIDDARGLYGRSNPTRTMSAPPPRQLYWGDTHCHSRFSADSAANNPLIASPEDDYEYARNRSDLDFCMVTDHIEDQSEEEWQETREAANRCCEPGRFVTFSGFEATFQPSRKNGDKNVYFFNDDEDWVNHGTTEELYENLRGRRGRVMVIPHLHAGVNWGQHDPELERVVEIYAHWGCGLSPESEPPLVPLRRNRRPETFVSHALEHGIKLGFIASADHSYGHPGDDFWWRLSSYNGGLAGVYADELTKEGVWDALWERRCYATTRARILLELDINGHPMGEELKQMAGERHICVKAYGTAAIESVEIIKNARTLHRRSKADALDVALTFVDQEAERETDYYYAHVMQVDGEQAWSSPIWVTSSG